MKYLLDTNVISELVAIQPNSNLIAWIESIDPEDIYLSVITIGELKKGIVKLPGSRRKEALEDWLNNDLLVRFQDRILPIETDTVIAWGSLVAHLDLIGKQMPAIDSLLAATAIQNGCTLITRNTRDFENAEISLINPWES